jgi:hypothetical protein
MTTQELIDFLEPALERHMHETDLAHYEHIQARQALIEYRDGGRTLAQLGALFDAFTVADVPLPDGLTTTPAAPAITIFDSCRTGLNATLGANGIAYDGLIYMDECWTNPTAQTDWSVIDAAKLTSLGTAKRLAGIKRVIIDIEYVNSPSSQMWHIQDESTRHLGIQGWLDVLDAFQDGYQQYGEVSFYDQMPSYSEIYRKIYENYPLDGVYGIDTQRAWELRWQEQMAPLVAAFDFLTPSHYGPWQEYDPTSLITPRNPKEVNKTQIFNYAIRDSYSEIQRVHGPTKCSFFFTTNQPAVWFGGGTGGGDGVLEFPSEILAWFFDQIVAYVPAGLRQVNMWQGGSPYRGYWTTAEVNTMLAYGTV